ncbi:unnamed protein product [Caenorhabditis angaria]|uniref:Chromo domain-containing protein n=1 Tax=Caenorhabditis angaria TaxID=860376 RepID=A0A9P1N664_9PELO|nr:unnamed protein product [Caenorhabditis angaria]
MQTTVIDEDDEDTFEVEQIIAHRVDRRKGLEFYVKWKDFDSTDNTWVHEADLDSPDLLDAYWREHASMVESREIEKEKRKSSTRRRMSSKQKSATPSRTIVEDEINEDPPGKSNTLSENNEVPVALPKKTHKKMRTPPPLPGRSKTKPINENNQIRSTSSSRSQTPLDNVTIRPKKQRTPVVIEENLPEIGGEPHEETPFENLEDMLDSPIVVVDDDVDEVVQEQNGENIDDKVSGIEKGYRISQILQTGVQDGIRYGLAQFMESNLAQWVALDVIREYDKAALIKYYESRHRQQFGI